MSWGSVSTCHCYARSASYESQLLSVLVLLALYGFSPQPATPAAMPQAIETPVLKWQNGGCYSSWCETGWYSCPAVADLDSIFVERFWRSLKYEDIYPRDYATVPDLEAGLQRHFAFYNDERPHRSLNYAVPGKVHQGVVTLVC